MVDFDTCKSLTFLSIFFKNRDKESGVFDFKQIVSFKEQY